MANKKPNILTTGTASLNGYYVCVNSHGDLDVRSIAGSEVQSIERFLENSDDKILWFEYIQQGWDCVQVDIDFKKT